MTAVVVAMAALSLASIGGGLTLTWALIKRSETIADLRERLAQKEAELTASDFDLDRLTKIYELSNERQQQAFESLVERRKANPSDPGDVLSNWRKLLEKFEDQTEAAAGSFRAVQRMRAAAAEARAKSAPVDSGDVQPSKSSVRDTIPGSRRAATGQDPGPGDLGGGRG